MALPLPRPSPLRKCVLVDLSNTEANWTVYSEILGMTKPTNTVRSSAWPTQGGLPSIINPAPFRGQIPALPVRSSVLEGIPPRAFSAVPIKPDPEMNTKTKTPSPQKQLTIKVDPASGKENLNVTVTPQSAR